MEKLAYFLVQVGKHMEKHTLYALLQDEIGSRYTVGGALLEGAAASWYVGLYRSRVPELHSFPHFMLALRQQFKDPFEEEKARVGLWQIRQGSRSMKVAQWAMVTAEPTSLAGWYMKAGEAEIRLRRVKLLKQRDKLPSAPSHPSLEGTSPARSGKEAKESLYAQRRWLGLCLNCGGKGHKAEACPSKKSDSLVGPTGGTAMAKTTPGPGKKSPFKKGSGLQVASREAISTPEEVGGPDSSEESAGNNSDLA
uniref:Uncharacterized protein n=1 Tax=Sphaerodactylus townsendi TaxID=933632 RepID=A0ACB8F7F8_9SAUR